MTDVVAYLPALVMVVLSVALLALSKRADRHPTHDVAGRGEGLDERP